MAKQADTYSDNNNRTIAYVWDIKIRTWLRGFRVKIANFSRLRCLAIPRRDLGTKKTKPNIEKWPESLGVMVNISDVGYRYLRSFSNHEGCPIHPNWIRWTKAMNNQTHRKSVRERLEERTWGGGDGSRTAYITCAARLFGLINGLQNSAFSTFSDATLLYIFQVSRELISGESDRLLPGRTVSIGSDRVCLPASSTRLFLLTTKRSLSWAVNTDQSALRLFPVPVAIWLDPPAGEDNRLKLSVLDMCGACADYLIERPYSS